MGVLLAIGFFILFGASVLILLSIRAHTWSQDKTTSALIHLDKSVRILAEHLTDMDHVLRGLHDE